MNQTTQKAPSTSDKNQPDPFDWSSVFPPGRIKTQIQQEDDNIGCLPKKTLELVSTCSTLLLRKIARTSFAFKEGSDEIGSEKATGAVSSNTVLLSARDIQKGIQEGPACLNFLQDEVDQAVRDDDGKIASRKSRKRKSAKSIDEACTSKPLAKMLKDTNATAGITRETLEEAVQLSQEASTQHNNDTVVLDEEDYD